MPFESAITFCYKLVHFNVNLFQEMFSESGTEIETLMNVLFQHEVFTIVILFHVY